MKRLFILYVFISVSYLLFAQAKKPTLMVVPATTWCNANGYVQEFNNDGMVTTIPDYQKVLNNDMDMQNTITKIGELMVEKDFPLKDMSSTLQSITREMSENSVTVSSSTGESLSESPLDRLMNRAKADILIEVSWKINSFGPKRSITYTLSGIDSYTHKQIAAAQGTGSPSLSAELPVLLEEAIVDKMDGFVSQLQRYFDDLMTNGREVALDVRVFNNKKNTNLETEFDGAELQDIIENWINQNTVSHRFNLTDASENIMRFEQVRIPLYNVNGMAEDTRSFANDLRKFLKTKINLNCKVLTKGLGKAVLVIDDK